MSVQRVIDVENFGLWELSVLSVLREGPKHPYEIQRLLRLRHKDEFLQLKKGSLYHAIRRLAAAGLIAEKETVREGLRPEKTSYEMTPAGLTAFGNWLRKLVSQLLPEATQFGAAISFLVYLSPTEAISALETRLGQLQQQIGELDQILALVGQNIGRIHVIEREYQRAVVQAEVSWILRVIEDIRSKKLTWDIEAILRQLRQTAPSKRRVKKRPQ